MKTTLQLLFFSAILLFNTSSGKTQVQKLNKEFKAQTIHQLAELINEFYVFPDVAKSTSSHLLKQWEENYYDVFADTESFAEALTTSVQSINHDKHMRVLLVPPYVATVNTPEKVLEERLERNIRLRESNAGFNTVEMLEGNVGYLDLRSFAGMDEGKDITDAYMKLLSQSDAIIIDLRKNSGGSPAMVQYLCSYFFNQHILLNTLYFRRGDELHEFWTLETVGGTKMPDVPLYVLTSEKTFSGAEEFSYNMQTQKRATLIGQTTGGGANPGQSMNLNEKLRVIMPMGMAINPVTNTNWEGTGVIPDIPSSAEESFGHAHLLAKNAAEVYRNETRERKTKIYLGLYRHLNQDTPDLSEASVYNSLDSCIEAGIMDESSINMLGYDYLMEQQKPKIAEYIFRANTLLFPNSPNTYDSYAEALMTNDQLKASLENYQKAVDLSEKYGNGDTELYKKNVELVKAKIAAKK